MRGCTSSSSSARPRARWPRRVWSGRPWICLTAPARSACARPDKWCSSPAISRSTRKAATTRATRRAAVSPASNEGDSPAVKAVRAEQHFTQPPPRFSEASLVKKMEELGIGRPSTYASTLQTLKDRDYVRIEKNRFFAEESGRLVTAFLERFFEKYVSASISPPGSRTSSTTSRAGGAQWQAVLDAFWKDFKPKTAEVMEQKPSEVTARARHLPRALPVPRQGRRHRSAALPELPRGQARAARRPVRRVHCLLQLSRVQIYPPLRPAGRSGGGWRHRPRGIGQGSGHWRDDHASLGAVRAVHPARRG